VTYFDGRIAERLGHSSTLIIDKIYADLTDVTRNDDIEKFEEYIEKYL
jgi:integrase